MNNFNNVLSKFDIKKSSGNTYQAICPAHDDHNPSLTIKVEKDKILLSCHAGCSTEDVTNAVGLKMSDLFLNSPKKNYVENQKYQIKFDYCDEHGALIFASVKTIANGEKKISYCQYDYNLKPVWNLNGVTLIPYRLPELIQALSQKETIFIPEGEKDVDNLLKIGLSATTNPFGAGKWKKSYNKYLMEANVVILEDNDEAGRNNTKHLCSILKSVCNSIKVVAFPDLPEKGDVSDWLENGHTKDELLNLIEKIPFTFEVNVRKELSIIRYNEFIDSIKKQVYEVGKLPMHEPIILAILENYSIKILSDNSKKKNFLIYKNGYWNIIENGQLSLLFRDFLEKHHRTGRIIKEIITSFEYTPNLIIPIDEFDKNDHLINFDNTCYDLENFKIVKHSPAHNFTHKLSFSFDETAKCPKFEQIIKEYSDNDEEWIMRLQEIMGYCLTGSFEYQVMFWFYGPKGRNGKGTLIRIITSLVGQKFSLPDFDSKQIVENRFYKSRLKGKRVAVAGDLSKKIYNVNTIKGITGGDEQISDVKFGEPESFIPKAKIIFAMNSLPIIAANENKEPLRHRIIFLPFYNQIKNPNSKIEDDLQKELSGIMNWAIEGLKRLMKNGKFTAHVQSDKLLEQFIDDDRPEKLFLKHYIEFDNKFDGLFLREIFERYSKFMQQNTSDKNWMRNKDEYITTPHKFKNMLQDEFPMLKFEKRYSAKHSGTNIFCKNIKFN